VVEILDIKEAYILLLQFLHEEPLPTTNVVDLPFLNKKGP